MIEFSIIQKLFIWAIPVLFAITVHEVAHGYVAFKLGDCTAKMLGRLTLNPAKHVDPLGTIFVPALLFFLGGFIFGWAKPVPINPNSFKSYRRDMILVAIAGPASNFLMAVLWAIIGNLALKLAPSMAYPAALLYQMALAGIMINLVLGIVNLIPVPPLDGSRVLASLLPNHLAYQYNRIEPFGFIILVVLIATGALSHILWPAYQAMLQQLLQVTGLN